ncbi:MAG: hypothetical protein N3D11_03390 [Candidatus Sumerlaeia bacterium]|nr:hypothetical protein [Candidatus Sumerlaeia bacterium]
MAPEQATSPANPSRPRVWLVVLILAAVYGAFYARTLAQATFVADDWYVIQPLSLRRFPHLLAGDVYAGRQSYASFYRPLPRMAIELCRRAFGFWTPGYLLVSAVFHVANCVLLWQIVLRLSGRRLTAWCAALLLTIYPTHPEALLMTSTLFDPMAVCGCLTALLGYLRLREVASARNWALALGGAILGALSKEIWITLPLVLLWAEVVYPPGGGRPFRRPDFSALRRLVVFFALALLYVVFRQIVLGGLGGYGQRLNAASAVETYRAVWQLVLAPFPGVEHYGAHWLNAVVLALAILLVWALSGFSRLGLLGSGWLALTPLPLFGLYVSFEIGSRYVYIVTIGWILLLSALLEKAMGTGQASRVRRSLAFAAAGLVALGLIAAQMNVMRDWRNMFRRNKAMVEKMVRVASQQPPGTQYAVMSWPWVMGTAMSNRLDSAAKALFTLTGIPGRYIDAGLSPDATTGTITFAGLPEGSLKAGRITSVERRLWSGAALEAWKPNGEIQFVGVSEDGAREYKIRGGIAEWVAPAIDCGPGVYCVLLNYQTEQSAPDALIWRETGHPPGTEQSALLLPIRRMGMECKMANTGMVEGLDHLAFRLMNNKQAFTLRLILLARFTIEPLR